LGLGVAYQEKLLGPKLAKVAARRASQRNLEPLLISATTEATDFKLGAQLGFLRLTYCRPIIEANY